MKKHILLVAALATTLATMAQHMNHMQHMQKDTTAKKPMKHDHAAMMKNMQHDTTRKMGMMTSQFSLDLPMNRDGSGTSWVPDETPMYMYMIHGKKWMHMVSWQRFFAL
jgi:Ni/Co efflux regulator RcnB